VPATPLLTYERCESSESVLRATAAVLGAHADRTDGPLPFMRHVRVG